MTIENYRKLHECLDIIEAALDEISAAVGHPTFKEFMQGQVQLAKAA